MILCFRRKLRISLPHNYERKKVVTAMKNNMIKKFVSVSLSVLMITAAAGTGVSAASAGNAPTSAASVYRGFVTDMNSDGTIKITGYSGSAKTVRIPSMINGRQVTVIGRSAFEGLTNIDSVTLPNTITIIEDHAFKGCTSLKSILLPYKVSSVNGSAFMGCTGLKEVIIPNSVTEIGFWAFASCTGLKNVYCYAENVPKTDINAFMSTSISTDTLRVPKAFVEAYQAASPWNGFGTFIALDIEPEVKKCATPTIDFVDGKIVFGCETEDVEYVCNIGFKNDGNILSLPNVITISVYATKDGYEPSDSLTLETTPKVLLDKFGDVNGDGIVNGTDIQEIINIIISN